MFFLAQKLGMTVKRMCEEMDDDELEMWSAYYALKAQRQELERLKAK